MFILHCTGVLLLSRFLVCGVSRPPEELCTDEKIFIGLYQSTDQLMVFMVGLCDTAVC